jgi:N-acetylneuraminic acid mutarotase
VHALPWRLPAPIAREAVVRLSARQVAVVGGLRPDDTSSGASYTLDLSTGHAHRGPSLPVPVHDTAGAFVGGHLLVIGGGNAAEQAVVQARSGSSWGVVGHLPAGRSDLAAVVTGGRVVVVGGYDGTTPALGDVLSSRDGVHWQRLGRLRVPVRYPGVAVWHGAAWVFGGERAGVMVWAVQRISLRTGRVSVIARLPRPLGHEAAVLLGDRILVVGGRIAENRLTSRMWWFDPAAHRFSPAGRLPHRLADTAVVQGHDVAWLVGGETPGFSSRVLMVASARH